MNNSSAAVHVLKRLKKYGVDFVAAYLGDSKNKESFLQGIAAQVMAEAAGFIFPVFYNGLLRLVKVFVERLSVYLETYCFAIANSGGTRANPLGMLEDILSPKGIIYPMGMRSG